VLIRRPFDIPLNHVSVEGVLLGHCL
jgi:hypothetical protein